MNIEKLRQRMAPDRPKGEIRMNCPLDVLEDLDRIAKLRGFSNGASLARAYVGQGLRNDLERFENGLEERTTPARPPAKVQKSKPLPQVSTKPTSRTAKA